MADLPQEESLSVMPVVIKNNNVNTLGVTLQIFDEGDIPYYEITIYPRDNKTIESIKEPCTLIPPNGMARFDKLEI